MKILLRNRNLVGTSILIVYRERISSMSAFKNEVDLGELVKIELYYESLCPYSRDFATGAFQDTVYIIGLYLDIHLYPYGNAKTIDNGSGNYTFVCQHGPEECYGNMLHACAIENLKSINSAILFNNCMMDMSRPKGSDNESADECGSFLDINSASIKQCANSDKAKQLLFHYGELSKKAGFKGVPYILVNGVQSSADTFLKDVCGAFKNPPAPCKANSTQEPI